MRKLLPFLIILIFAYFGLRSLIDSPFYTSHDGFTHTARIAAYNKILNDRQFPPRWAADLNGTLGSPIFVYSYSLPYFLGSVIHNAGFPYQDSFRMVMGLSFILGSIGMYLWLKTKYGVLPGLTAAIFYMYVPYRFLNLYVRAAYAESFAYAILPFIFLSIERYKHSQNKVFWWGMAALTTSLLLLSHNVVSAIFLPLILAWIVLTYWQKWISIIKLFGALITGVLIGSFIYIPDLFELHFTRFNQGISYFSEHFVSLYQLIRSPWDYGFDFPGSANDAMSFQLGLAQLLVVGLVLAFIIFKRKFQVEPLFFLLVFFCVIILMVEAPYSIFLWKTIPMLAKIVDFPWRLLGLAAFIFAILSAYLVSVSRFKLLIFILLICAVTIANRNFMRVNDKLSFSDDVFDSYVGSSTAFNEYLPIGHKTTQIPEAIAPVDALQGNPNVRVIARNSQGIIFDATSKEEAQIRINRFYFPKTEISKDGIVLRENKDWFINNEIQSTEFDDSGTIFLKIHSPGGRYEVKFTETPVRKFANILSVVSFLAVLIVLALSIIKKPHEKI